MNILENYEFVTLKSYSHNKVKSYEFTSKNYAFLDIETAKTSEQDTCSSAVSFSMCDYNNSFAIARKYTTTQENLYKEMLEIVYYFTSDKLKKLRCYYHNTTFDCTFLLIELNKLGYKQVDKIDEKTLDITDKYYTLIVANNRIIQLEYTYKAKIYQIWDTFNIWATGLRQVSSECCKLNKQANEQGENLPFPNIFDKEQDTDFNYTEIRDVGSRYTKDELKYCINDVVSSSAIIKLFSFLDLKMTISATAYNTCMKSFIDGLYIHNSICFIIKGMIINNTLDNINLSSLVHSIRTDKGYNIYSNNYYEIYDDNTLLCNISFSECNKGDKTTAKHLYNDNFNNIKTKIFNKIIDMNFSTLDNELSKMSLFYQYKKKDFKSLFQFLTHYFTFNHGGSVKTSSKHFIKIKEDLQEFQFHYFPKISMHLDKLLRNGYKGGICQVNSIYQYQVVNNVYHIDINSSYPYKCRDCRLPVGEPTFYNYCKEPTVNTICMYIFTCNYNIKSGYLPTILSKNSFGMAKMSTHGTVIDMLKNTDEQKRFLYLYDVEFQLFKKHYNISNLTVIKTIEFKAVEKLFYAYNDKFYKFKQTKKGTALYQPSKILLNSVTGKFGQNKYRMEREKVLANFDKGYLKFVKVENKDFNESKINTYYLPVVSYITALSRVQLMEGCDKIMENGGKVYYMDTDSIFFSADNVSINSDKYLTINNIDTDILIDKNILGAWDMEHSNISKAIFICPKRYFLDIDGNEIVKDCKCAGVSNKYAKNIHFSDFKLGNKFKTMHRLKTEKGVDLIEDVKELRYSEILYKTNICTLSSVELYKQGDIVQNIYGDICIIQDILYIPPKFKYWEENFYNDNE